MQQQNLENIFEVAKNLVMDAGKQLRTSFQKPLTIDFKENLSDLVTNMDKQIEQFFVKKIKEFFPSHRVLGEEGYGNDVTSLEGTVWIIDPIDGTMNFVHMQRHFGISLGIYQDGEGLIGIIYDVAFGDLYYAIKGKGAYLNDERLPVLQGKDVHQAVIGINAAWGIKNKRISATILPPLIKDLRGTRSFGSAALELAYVASGKMDGYISLRLSPWDYAAGKVLIEEVGGVLSTLKGQPLDLLSKQTPVFAAKPDLHEKIITHYFLK